MAHAAGPKTKTFTSDQVREIFSSIDLNGDGQVSLTEFGMLLARLGVAMSEDKRTALFADADKDGSGSIDVDELAAFLESSPVESETSLSARAVRAGLTAQYYASAFQKTLSGVSSGVSSAMHEVKVGLDVNGGCSAEEAATIILAVADHDSSRVDASIAGKETAVFFCIGLDASVDRGAVEAFVTAGSEGVGVPVAVAWGPEADGEVLMSVSVDVPDDASELVKLEPLREMAAGVELKVRVLSREPLAAIIDQDVPAAKAAGRVELTGTISANLITSLGAPMPMGSVIGGISPTKIALDTGLSVLQALGMEGASDEDLLSAQADFKPFKVLRSVRAALADPEEAESIPPGGVELFTALRSIRTVHAVAKGAVLTVEIAGGAFRIIKE